MPSALFTPPRLRTVEAEVGRRTTWFELFFDLVFVLAIAALARNLHDDHSLTGFVGFVGLSVPVWWAWVIYTFYADRFDTDDVVYRLMVMAGMVAIAAMAASLRTALHGGASTFVIAYLLVRAVPALLYIRAARHEPQARRMARNFGIGSLAAACFWLPSLAVPTPWRYVLWGCAVAIETTLPLIVRRTVAATPMHVSHLGERFGLFTVIVIGEAVVAVGASVASVTWHAGTVAAAICTFAIAGALWWIYFDFGSDAIAASSFWRTQLYVFGHLPVVVGSQRLRRDRGWQSSTPTTPRSPPADALRFAAELPSISWRSVLSPSRSRAFRARLGGHGSLPRSQRYCCSPSARSCVRLCSSRSCSSSWLRRERASSGVLCEPSQSSGSRTIVRRPRLNPDPIT